MRLVFKDIITDSWFSEALDRGTWDAEHGSDLGYLIESIQAGEWDHVQCPAELAALPVVEAFRNPEMVAILKQWLRGRFEEVLEFLPVASEIAVRRVMRVDHDWIAGLADGTSTSGIYFGDQEMDTDGGYWINENLPFEVLIDAHVRSVDVDWKGTVLARIDHLTGDREAEIRLTEYATINVRSIQIDGEFMTKFPRIMSTGEKRSRPTMGYGPKI